MKWPFIFHYFKKKNCIFFSYTLTHTGIRPILFVFFLRYIRLLFVCFVGWLFEDKKMNKCQQKFLEIILEREKRNEFGTWILFVISVLIHSRRHHHRHVSIAYFFIIIIIDGDGLANTKIALILYFHCVKTKWIWKWKMNKLIILDPRNSGRVEISAKMRESIWQNDSCRSSHISYLLLSFFSNSLQ